MKKLIAATLALFMLATLASAQMAGGKKPASPPASTQCKFSDGKSIKIDYSSPRAKGRKIFGTGDALVPYGEVWRTGANDATTFVATANVNVGGKDVPAGNYTIFTVPNADKWMLIINKKTGEWGIPYKYESDELGRVPMMVSKTSGPVENFTIAFDQAGSKCTLRMEWENTRASVEISEK
ncbi:MAG TPA: DUF2911 domain-containing protein [Terriglobales bacterium]|nr:DUF2911 domain-containing protein [Terriglobales bacterium]